MSDTELDPEMGIDEPVRDSADEPLEKTLDELFGDSEDVIVDAYSVRKDYEELFPEDTETLTDMRLSDWDDMAEWMNDNPYDASEEEVEPEVEIPHVPTVMSKLIGSVDMPEEFKFGDKMVFYTMLRNIFRGKSILVTGPSGCGKSSLGKILADITNKPFYAFNFGDTMNPAAKILGDTKYNAEVGTFFKQSRFVQS